MNKLELSLARHHVYLLLSRLYLHGLSADLLPHVQEIPELAEFAAASLDQDGEAARHYQVLGHEILPYESIFRDPSGLLGGSCAVEVNEAYHAATIAFGHEGDHLGHELAFLAALCAAEASAEQDRDAEGVDRYVEHQSRFMAHHLLPWLSPFIVALSSSHAEFYAALARLTLDVVGDHWHALASHTPDSVSPWLSPDPPPTLTQLISQERTNLKRIASFLTTPPLSGFYLGRETISRFARKNKLPRGFGSRQQMLSNLFYTAVQYDLLSDVIRDLVSTGEFWLEAYRRQISFFPELERFIKPWATLVEHTMDGLQQMVLVASEMPILPQTIRDERSL